MHLFRLFKDAFKHWRLHEAPRLAASLSYYTIFSLAPLLLIVIAIAGLAVGHEAAQGHLFDQLQDLVGPRSAQAIQSMIAATWKPEKNVWALVISLIAVLVGATGVLSELKSGLNRVWQAKEPDGLIHLVVERAKYLGLILGIGFLLIVSLAISAGLAAMGKFLAQSFPFSQTLQHVSDFMISVGVITVLFAMLFKYIPDREIPWKPVWIGAVLTSVLFTAGKAILGLYLGKSAVASSYGAAGAIMIILLWVYYAGLIFYFGAEFIKAYVDARSRGPRP